jgi:hypothetical protein
MPAALDTNAKALRINLDQAHYGTFAEIGGGQEASRWFFRVGGAAGTVAKTISAYDMTVSDAIYGHGERYVSRARAVSMLDHEHSLITERLAVKRGDSTAFFAFADTVATRSFKGDNEAHGWIGLRFQHAPGTPPSQLLLHVALQEPSAQLQQHSLGVLGVNTLYAAFYLRTDRNEFFASLFDDIPPDALHIDVAELEGPAFPWNTSPGEVATQLLAHRLTPAVAFDETGRMDQPSSALRTRGLLVYRTAPHSANPELHAMLDSAAALLRAEAPEVEPLPVLECSCNAADADPRTDAPLNICAEFASIVGPGHATLLTAFTENFRLSTYLRRLTTFPIRYVIGIDHLVAILRSRFYNAIDGGILEGLGRLLAPDTRLYVYAMPPALLRSRLARHAIDESFCTFPEKPLVTIDDLCIAPPTGHLLAFLRDAGWIKAALPTPSPARLPVSVTTPPSAPLSTPGAGR